MGNNFFVLKLYLLLFNEIIIKFINSQNADEEVRNCRERNRLITTEKGDLYALIDATLSQTLILQCHYCNELDSEKSKIWSTVNLFNISKTEEVKLDMKNNNHNNRRYIDNEHSLVIKNLSYSDTGIYFCVPTEEQTTQNRINYLVDLVEKQNRSNIEYGNLTTWLQYCEHNFLPINYLFKKSASPEYIYLREKLNLTLEIKNDWDVWGACEVCGRKKGDGIQRRRGFCRLKIHGSIDYAPIDRHKYIADEIFLMRASAISCRSFVLKRLTPIIFNTTKVVPDFVEERPCEGICNPDAKGINVGWKTGKTKSFKYRKSVVLEENDHLIFVCPESTIENKVVWKKNGFVLKRGEAVNVGAEEPHVIVDTFSTLYLVEVTESETGNYTCIVDDVNMLRVIVFVVAKSKLLSKVLLRHLLYITFIISLTLTCYFAGLFIACKRKHTFKTYHQLKLEEKELGIEDSDDEL